MDASSPSQNRRSNRSRVLLAAQLETRAGTLEVKLRNLSAEGALIEAENLPIEGAEVIFRRNELIEPGHVVWVDGKHAGVAFKNPLQPEQVLRHVSNPRPKVQLKSRRPGLACRELTAEERRLVENWVQSPILSRPGE